MPSHHDDPGPNTVDTTAQFPDPGQQRVAALAFGACLGAGGVTVWLAAANDLARIPLVGILLLVGAAAMVAGRRWADLRHDAMLAAIIAELDQANATGRPYSRAVVERLRRLAAHDRAHADCAEYTLLREEARRDSLLRQVVGLAPKPSRISDSTALTMARGIDRSDRISDAVAEGDYRLAAELLRRGGRWHVVVFR